MIGLVFKLTLCVRLLLVYKRLLSFSELTRLLTFIIIFLTFITSMETTISLSNGTIDDHLRHPLPSKGVPNTLPGPTSRRVLPPGEYDRTYRRQAMCCARCRYEQSNVTFCQITLALCYLDYFR